MAITKSEWRAMRLDAKRETLAAMRNQLNSEIAMIERFVGDLKSSVARAEAGNPCAMSSAECDLSNIANTTVRAAAIAAKIDILAEMLGDLAEIENAPISA